MTVALAVRAQTVDAARERGQHDVSKGSKRSGNEKKSRRRVKTKCAMSVDPVEQGPCCESRKKLTVA